MTNDENENENETAPEWATGLRTNLVLPDEILDDVLITYQNTTYRIERFGDSILLMEVDSDD